jgi:hypothetical protein
VYCCFEGWLQAAIWLYKPAAVCDCCWLLPVAVLRPARAGLTWLPAGAAAVPPMHACSLMWPGERRSLLTSSPPLLLLLDHAGP